MKISSADRILSLWFVRVSLPFASSDRGEHVTCLCLHRCQPAGVRAPLGKKLTALVKGALRRAKIERELCVQMCHCCLQSCFGACCFDSCVVRPSF